MTEAALNTVGCPACHKRFVWKAELSGKAVKCTCGKAFIIPGGPQDLPLHGPAAGAAKAILENSDFESPSSTESSAPPALCSSCNLPMKAGAALCLNCGYDVRTKGKVGTKVVAVDLEQEVEPVLLEEAPPPSPDFLAPQDDQTPRPTPFRGRSKVTQALVDRADDQGESRFINLYLPILFIVAGLGLTVVHALQEDQTVAAGFVRAGIHLLLKVPLMLGALVLTANLLGISYGPLSVGLLKLAGIAMGPMALADVILGSIMSATLGFGIWLGIFFYFIIAGIPLSFMFDLEINETLITLVIIIVLEVFFKLVVITLIFGMLF